MLFNELTTEQQSEAIINMRDDDYLSYSWWDDTKEDFYSILDILGYYDITSYFSGFWSQGDGASFKAMYLYGVGAVAKIKEYAPQDQELHRIASELQAIQKKCRYDLGSTIDISGSNYYHEMTMINNNWSNRDLVTEDTVDSFTDETLELHRDLARWYYKSLEAEYDYLMSDEAIAEHIEANEYEFDYEDN